MQKVYLLLRNNQQTGPHSLDELAQLGLKNSDLIWIEGQSAGWYYPYEVDDLKPLLTPAARTEVLQKNGSAKASRPVTEATVQAPKKIFVSLPGNAKPKTAPIAKKTDNDYIEHRAELLRKKVQAVPLEKPDQQEVPPVSEHIHVAPPIIEKKETPAVAPQFEIEEIPTFYSQQPVASQVLPVVTTEVPQPMEEQQLPSLQNKTIAPPLASNRPKPSEEHEVYATTISKANPVKKNGALANRLAGVAVILLFIAGGWWLYKSFAGKKEQSQVAQQTTQVKPAEQQTGVPPEIVAENNLTTTVTTENPVEALQEKIAANDKPKQNQKKARSREKNK